VYNFVETHFILLNDAVRVAAYERAIAAIVKPGDVVLDLGTGTGVMGLLACRAGASRVYSIEASGMVEGVRNIVRANGLEDRMVCLYGDSKDLELPERVDVAITDQAGPFGIGGRLFGSLNDAHRRLLKPRARMIPSHIDLSIGLAELPQGWATVKFWDERPLGFDMSAMCALARNVAYEIKFSPEQLLSAPGCVLSLDLAARTEPAMGGSTTLVAGRPGTLHGLFAFFSAELAPAVSISNSPLGRDSINRRAWFLPVERAIALEAGDSAAIMVQLLPAEEIVMWQVAVTGVDGALKEQFTHSTFKSTLVAREDLQKMRPEYMPRLSASGEVERATLELCDGTRSLRRIVQEIHIRFPKNFRSRDEVAAAVSRVVVKKTH
jgi:protein arginine N-methyltransferase 1